MSEQIGKLYQYDDPRLEQEMQRLYDIIQNGLLGRNQINTREIAQLVGREVGAGIPEQTVDGRAIKLNSILGNRLVDGIIGANALDDATASRIHADATWTIGTELSDVIEIDVQLDTVKTALSAVSSTCVLWASTSNNKNAAPPTTSFVSATVTTGTLLSDLGQIPATAELCLLCATTTAGRLIVDVEVSGGQTLYFYVSSGPMIAESGAVTWAP
ncbi:MAG: hypothetical protein ABFS46_08840 [Myxococcota bacterium]